MGKKSKNAEFLFKYLNMSAGMERKDRKKCLAPKQMKSRDVTKRQEMKNIKKTQLFTVTSVLLL